MKYYIPIVLLLSLLVFSCDNSSDTKEQEKSPLAKGVVFPNSTYSHAIAYHFEDLEGGHIMDKHGKLNPTIKKEKTLSQDEIDSFLNTINKDETYGGPYTRCFKPRLGVVFYQDKAPVAHISICFECSQQTSFPQIQAYNAAPMGEHGYSEMGFNALTSFCRKLGFGQCGE